MVDFDCENCSETFEEPLNSPRQEISLESDEGASVMGLLDRLLGRHGPKAAPEVEPTTPLSKENLFDLVSKAEEAWEANQMPHAEALFHQAIEVHRCTKPEGVDFVLGRYGAFLLANARPDEAAAVLEEAVKMGTRIGMVWSDYMRILTRRRDFAGLFATADQMAALGGSLAGRTDTLLIYAGLADREGDPSFAEAVARRAMEEATARGNRTARWTAAGVLGEILERTGRVKEAVRLWTETFEEGSKDSTTIKRLSMHFERAKEYLRASTVVRDALSRGLPANIGELLRKRLARCEDKLSPGHKRTHIPAFSIRHGEGFFEPVLQVRMRIPIRVAQIVESIARCLCVTKGEASLIDLDLATGAELRRIGGLPDFDKIHFAPSGWGIGIKRTAPVGAGPTKIWFLNPAGSIAIEGAVPDATSQIALGSDLWYVGCRDGRLYTFDFGGRQHWVWETPGSRDFQGNAYARPCPYYVASGGSLVVVASWGNVYTVNKLGALLWHHEFSAEHSDQQTLWLSTGKSLASHEAYRILGLAPGVSQTDIKAAYRRLVLATHPDRNPTDPNANTKFREVQRAYEAVEIEDGVDEEGPVVALTMQVMGLGPPVSSLGASDQGVVAGFDGRMFIFDIAGRVRAVRALGRGEVCIALREDGSSAVAWCDGVLFSLHDDKVINVADSPGYPPGLGVFGENVVLWRGNRIEVMDPLLQQLWAAEFPRVVKMVAAHRDRLICAAGVLAAFRKNQ